MAAIRMVSRYEKDFETALENHYCCICGGPNRWETVIDAFIFGNAVSFEIAIPFKVQGNGDFRAFYYRCSMRAKISALICKGASLDNWNIAGFCLGTQPDLEKSLKVCGLEGEYYFFGRYDSCDRKGMIRFGSDIFKVIS
jgi:hypothetical protein